MRRFLSLTAVFLISALASAAPVKAGEPMPADSSSGIETTAINLAPPADSAKVTVPDLTGARSGKAAFVNATPAIRVAPCGIEADARNTNLDAGLIDFNVPDPARAAGHAYDDQRDVGRNVGDYHSTVILGITVGYHF